MGTFQLHKIDSITSSDGRRIVESCPECHSPAYMTGMGFMRCVWDAWGIVVCYFKPDQGLNVYTDFNFVQASCRWLHRYFPQTRAYSEARRYVPGKLTSQAKDN